MCVCGSEFTRVFGLRACVLTWLPASWLACVLLVVPLPARVCSFLPFAYYSVVADTRVACRIPTLRHYAHQHTCNAFSVVASSSGMSSSAAKDPKRVYQLGGETETNLVAEGLLWTGSPIARPRDRRKIRFEGPHA